jgi:hypothetical protein
MTKNLQRGHHVLATELKKNRYLVGTVITVALIYELGYDKFRFM